MDAIENAGADHVLPEEGVVGTVLGTTVVSISNNEDTDPADGDLPEVS